MQVPTNIEQLTGYRNAAGYNSEQNRRVIMTRATLRKWGKNLAIRIPEPLADALSFQPGSLVDIINVDGCLVIKRCVPRRKYRLSQLLSQCTGPNPSPELIKGSVGSEAI
jgi:antitoxin component of MazEF toxin-antitoxin module